MAELTITNNTLRYGARVYPIHNLTQTYVQERERLPRFGLFTILFCLALAWLLCIHEPLIVERLALQWFGRQPAWPAWLYVLAGLALFAIACYGLWDRTQLTYYTLFVETSAGSSSLLQSRDKKGIEAIAQAIINVMENRTTAATYHINVDQSKVTFGDEFSNIGSGANINNRSEIKH
ncbi:DUF6232 family protein [Janthinobacterium sp. PSPC2-1]|uniref:DUF6232 family protein n=1 Tax=unclassified Janthinobacterium TaxID=2610881 RepID=UPI003CF292FC